jgi:hypothetical protein
MNTKPMESLDIWMIRVSKRAFCKLPTLWNTYFQTRLVIKLGVPGDLVECGVAAGVQPAVMARACIDAGAERRIRLFDSFRGIPAPTYKDGPEAAQLEGKAACSMQAVHSHLAEWGVGSLMKFVYHPGWFEQTVSASPRFPIALLRLDGDLYSSTKICLERFEPQLSDNGILVIDDSMPGVRLAVAEYFGRRGDFAPLYWHKGQK